MEKRNLRISFFAAVDRGASTDLINRINNRTGAAPVFYLFQRGSSYGQATATAQRIFRDPMKIRFILQRRFGRSQKKRNRVGGPTRCAATQYIFSHLPVPASNPVERKTAPKHFCGGCGGIGRGYFRKKEKRGAAWRGILRCTTENQAIWSPHLANPRSQRAVSLTGCTSGNSPSPVLPRGCSGFSSTCHNIAWSCREISAPDGRNSAGRVVRGVP